MNMILRALMVSVWFMALTFPLVVLKVDALNDTILFRWENMASIGVGAFVLSIFWRWSMERKARGAVSTGPSLFARALEAVRQPKPRYTCLGLIAVLMLVMPYISSMYQINIMISALIYIMLGLGLNIVVGLAGQLVLGYAAFYAVGAYTYGLLNTYFGLGFWAVLPVGGIMAALFGLMLGFPVLRLKGDYLAIVTLGFGEIIRLVLENWTSVTKGSFGLSNLSRPSLFGMEMGVTEATNYIYYIVLAAVVVTIIVVGRLKNSRIGLALQALREDEIACEAMGIDLTKVKLSAFALGSCWAGFAGVIFAAKTTFINPASFTFMESAMVLSMVVLGGMGSVLGVTIGEVVAAAYMLVQAALARGETRVRALDPAVRPTLTLAKTLLSLSIPITISSSVMSITDLIDVALISSRLQSPAVHMAADEAMQTYGIYTGVINFFNLPQTLITALAVSVLPTIASARAAGNETGANRTLSTTLRMTLMLTLPAGAGFFLLGGPILRIFLSSGTVLGGQLMSILGFAVPAVALVAVTNAVLQAYSRIDLPLVSMCLGAAVKLCGDYFMIGDPRFSIAGAPISTALCYWLIALLNLFHIARLSHGLPPVGRTLVRPLAATAGMGAVVVIGKTLVRLAGLAPGSALDKLATLAIIAAAALVYGVLLLALRAIERADVLLLPHGAKIADILHLK